MEIETNGLLIRSFQPGDFSQVACYMSDEETTHFLPSGRMTDDDVADFLIDNKKAFAVILVTNGELIGHIEFFACYGDHTYEIGWVFNKRYQKKGYAYKAASAVIRHGFENLDIHRIIATCQPENPASFKLMEKLGMVREGDFRQCIPRGDGVWWDEFLYAILRSDYDQANRFTL